MSPTLLEFVVAIIVIVVAWQIGLALAPDVLRLLRHLKRDIDDVTAEALADDHSQTSDPLSNKQNK